MVGATARIVGSCGDLIADGGVVRLDHFHFKDRTWQVTSETGNAVTFRIPMASVDVIRKAETQDTFYGEEASSSAMATGKRARMDEACEEVDCNGEATRRQRSSQNIDEWVELGRKHWAKIADKL